MNENLLYRLYTGTGTTLDAAMKEATDSYNIGYVHNTTNGYFAADIQSETLYVSGIYHFVIKVVYKRANKVANDVAMLRAMNNFAPDNKVAADTHVVATIPMVKSITDVADFIVKFSEQVFKQVSAITNIEVLQTPKSDIVNIRVYGIKK